ncbi:MAG: hypothetical protein ACQXXH_01705 [Candidatus Bathyarchaeia archaeon]|nr:hypothetical protein [Candidatus Bathyarchaeota archaeon A05DMB-4]
MAVTFVKKQIGVWVDAAVWHAYRELCSKERFRPAEPIEKFLQFILHNGSILPILNLMETVGKAEGFEAYVRVLLGWYRNGKLWMYITDEDEAPIEPMLLEALKLVANCKLRQEIEESLTKIAQKKQGEN